MKKPKETVSPLLSEIYIKLPTPGIRKPVFIIGCGRSGTTILGKALSLHPAITYLNEPRHLWFRAYPETDIWSGRAEGGAGKLLLTAADANPAGTRKLSRLFRLETLRTRRPVLVEKLPANSFRLAFIQGMFPDARYVHILRDGLEVARSIEKRVPQGWFGAGDCKWKLLAEYASGREETRPIPDRCADGYERGLLEWRLGTEAVLDFFGRLSAESRYEIRYDRLVADPVRAIGDCLSFLGLEGSRAVDDFARENIRRRSERRSAAALTAREDFIAGKLLRQVREGAG
jgi:hypothetical protein